MRYALGMRLSSFEAIIQSLNQAGVRYLVAGGLAVNAHGYGRFTQDIDLVLQLDQHNIEQALAALRPLGYQPALPVQDTDFADPDIREDWVRNRNMKVFQLVSDQHPETSVDIFAEEPFEFDHEYGECLEKPLTGVGMVRFVSLPTLIKMKQEAGRPQDLADIDNLRLRIDDNE